MSELLLLGASGLAREVMAMVRGGDEYDVLGVLDDNPSLEHSLLDGAHVLGSLELVARYTRAMVAVCSLEGALRESTVRRLAELGVTENRYATLLHPSVEIPEGCFVGVGSVLMANVVLTSDVVLGRHVVAMPGATFTHDVVVDDFATVGSGAALGGAVQIGRCACLGMNSSIRERIRIGEHAMIGMGAVVLKDVPASQTWVGVPARFLREGGADEAGLIDGTAESA